ncbi:rhodanese-like domain-containing protein [Nonomuraea sp. NPDC002799]
MTTVTFAEIERWRAESRPHALFDVRERGEYALGKIPGSCPLPRGLIEIHLPRLVPWQDTPLVLYSNDEHRSGLAALTCRRLGHRDVTILEGGLRRWTEAGHTPLYGVSVTGKTFAEKLSSTDQVQQLGIDEVAGLADSGKPLLFDLRTAGEYLKGHVPGAHHVPAEELVPSLFAAGIDHAAPIVLHCAGRTRSIVGAYLLKQAGFDNVFALRNGTMAWVLSGRELETEPRPWIAPVADPAGPERAAAFASSFVSDTDAAPIQASEVAAMAEAGQACYVIDVRLAEEYAAGHLPGALSCPAGLLVNALEEQVAVRDAVLVCYSNDETRARIGAGLLSRIGYHRVAWLAGGLDRWAETGAVVAGGPHAYLDDLTFTGPGVRTIDHDRLRANVGVLVDVRRSSEYALSHIPGSVWLPRGDLERRIGAYAQTGTSVVVVSDRELRSALAARTLLDLGYRDVAILKGGLNGWIAAGGPTEDGLDGADVPLAEAKEEVELLARRARVLERDRDDMIRYLDWEERLGS